MTSASRSVSEIVMAIHPSTMALVDSRQTLLRLSTRSLVDNGARPAFHAQIGIHKREAPRKAGLRSSLACCWAKQPKALPLAALIGITLAFLIGFAARHVFRTRLACLVALTLGGLILPGVGSRVIRTADA